MNGDAGMSGESFPEPGCCESGRMASVIAGGWLDCRLADIGGVRAVCAVTGVILWPMDSLLVMIWCFAGLCASGFPACSSANLRLMRRSASCTECVVHAYIYMQLIHAYTYMHKRTCSPAQMVAANATQEGQCVEFMFVSKYVRA